eukprot:ANDGO_08617.mRNA.1 hypothetical protein
MSLLPIESRIASEVQRHRIRLRDSFRDFDKLRLGHVSREQSRRILATMGFGMSEAEYQQLSDKYALRDNDTALFVYDAFLKTIDEAASAAASEVVSSGSGSGFGSGGFAPISPTARSIKGGSFAPAAGSRSLDTTSSSSLTEGDDVSAKLIPRLRQFVATRRLHPRIFFEDFDKLRRGIVTRSQFSRGCQVGFGGALNNGEISQLADYYAVHKGADEASSLRRSGGPIAGNGEDIAYAKFHYDLTANSDDSAVAAAAAPSPTVQNTVSRNLASSFSGSASVSANRSDPEERLRAYAATLRIRFAELFQDSDKLRTGRVPRSAFVSALGSLKLPRGDQLSAAELEEIADRYQELVSPVANGGSPNRPFSFANVQPIALIRWKEFTTKMDAPVGSMLADSVLDSTAVRSLSPTRNPVSPSAKNGTRSFEISGDSPTADSSCASANANADGNREVALQQVLQRIRDRVRTRRMAIREILADFDRVCTGVYATGRISKERFRRALATLGFALGDAEYSVLEERYGAKDSTVLYKLFLDDVDNVKEMVGQSVF